MFYVFISCLYLVILFLLSFFNVFTCLYNDLSSYLMSLHVTSNISICLFNVFIWLSYVFICLFKMLNVLWYCMCLFIQWFYVYSMFNLFVQPIFFLFIQRFPSLLPIILFLYTQRLICLSNVFSYVYRKFYLFVQCLFFFFLFSVLIVNPMCLFCWFNVLFVYPLF